MNFLTHLCLPLAVVFVVRSELTDAPAALALGVFGLLPDLDKFLGIQGLFHSIVTLLPICLGVLAVEWWLRGRFEFGPIIVALVGSHLLLDFIDGGPVPLLFPLVETGIGLTYPARTVFGAGLFGVVIRGPLVAIQTPVPRSGHQAFGFIDGTGVLSVLVLASVYLAQSDGLPWTATDN